MYVTLRPEVKTLTDGSVVAHFLQSVASWVPDKAWDAPTENIFDVAEILAGKALSPFPEHWDGVPLAGMVGTLFVWSAPQQKVVEVLLEAMTQALARAGVRV